MLKCWLNRENVCKVKSTGYLHRHRVESFRVQVSFKMYDMCMQGEIMWPCPSTRTQLFCHQQELDHDFRHKQHTSPPTFCWSVCEQYHPFASLHPFSYNKFDDTVRQQEVDRFYSWMSARLVIQDPDFRYVEELIFKLLSQLTGGARSIYQQ